MSSYSFKNYQTLKSEYQKINLLLRLPSNKRPDSHIGFPLNFPYNSKQTKKQRCKKYKHNGRKEVMYT